MSKNKIKNFDYAGDLFSFVEDDSIAMNIINNKNDALGNANNFKKIENVSYETLENLKNINQRQIFKVGEINKLIKNLLEENFSEIWIEGEISNSKLHSSGHYYFSLKDETGQLKAIMFNHLYSYLKFIPKEGMKVLIKGSISCFVKGGTYQINVVYMEPKGIGALQLAFEQLKEKLLKEGLFDLKYKKKIPLFPQKVGIITSPTGAAIRDILSILKRRFFNLNIILYPVKVQGDDAKFEIVEAIRYFNFLNKVDVLLVGRGGGSIEDLWAFNEEIVAREIFKSSIPIISCVGHEVDFVISDFVADLRAATPSAAAELLIKDKNEIKNNIDFLNNKLKNKMEAILNLYKTRFEYFKNVKILKNPILFFENKSQILDYIFEKIVINMEKKLDKNAYALGKLIAKIDAMNPIKIISKGYAVIKENSLNGKILNSEEIVVGKEINVFLKEYKFLCKVLDKKEKDNVSCETKRKNI
jgi:exodeoxyribonuclease VII large subunit